MDIYIEIGFIFLCISVLVGIIGIIKYHFLMTKEKIDIGPATDINHPQTTNRD